MKLIFTLLTIFSFLSATAQQYYTGFDSASEKAGWTQYKKGVDSAPYEWSYGTINPYSAPEYLTHNYPVGGTQQTDDWFVGPLFYVFVGGVIDSLYYSFSGFGTPMAGDTIGLYLLEGSPDPALASNKTMLYNFTDSVYLNDNVWRSINAIYFSGANGTPYYLAFRYSTVANWLDVKFDDLSVTVFSGIDEAGLNPVKLYPNPARDQFIVESGETEVKELEILDLAGRPVLKITEVNKQVDVSSLPAGIYTVNARTRDGYFSSKLLIRK